MHHPSLLSGPQSSTVAECRRRFLSSKPVNKHQSLCICVCRYAIVTRPVRQSRLKLALEEVMSTQPDPTLPQLPSTKQPTAVLKPFTPASDAHCADAAESSAEPQSQFCQQAPGCETMHNGSNQQAMRPSSVSTPFQEPQAPDSDPGSSVYSNNPHSLASDVEAASHQRNSLQRAPKVSSPTNASCSCHTQAAPSGHLLTALCGATPLPMSNQ